MYNYETEKKYVFTDEGQRKMLRMRDKAFGFCKLTGCCRGQEVISSESVMSWETMACLDRLVEIGDLIEIPQPQTTAWQHRVFRRPLTD